MAQINNMKIKTKSIAIAATMFTIAAAAFASYTSVTRLVDGASGDAKYVAYSRDSGSGRYAYLKHNGTQYEVLVAGAGITGAEVCNGSVEIVSRPAISRDGEIVTFWGYDPLEYEISPYAYIVDQDSLVDMHTFDVVILPIELWPPQPSNIDEEGNYKVVFNDLDTGKPAPPGNTCSGTTGNAYWQTGQLYRYNSAGGSGYVSTGDGSNACPYLVTEEVSHRGTKQYPAWVSTFTIDSTGNMVTWAAKAINSMSGVTQSNRQIVQRNVSTNARDLISKNASSGNEGNADSDNHSMTGDANRIAFASQATNLTSYSTDYNGVADIFRRDRSANATIAAYNLSLTNTGTLNDGPSGEPTISGDGNFIAFHSTAIGLLSYYSTIGYGIGGTPYSFLSDITSGTPALELASFKVGDPTDWRAGAFPSIDYDADTYGFHSIEGDIASPVQSAGLTDIYELSGHY